MTGIAAPAAAPREAHVRLIGVTKHFGGVRALRDVDLTIERASIHALVGENGAGKSTLGKIVAGVHRADGGEVFIDGRRVNYGSPREALDDGVTMIGQEPTLVPHRSVLENVFLGIEAGRSRVVDVRALRRAYAELSEQAGFALPPDVRAGSLRVADQQKAEVLRALARGARLIVMDEPTAALARDEAERVFAMVRMLRERGTTIIYVSHYLSEVLSLADTVTVLRDGEQVRTSAASAETPDSLVTAMLGRSMELTFPEKDFPPADAPVVLEARGLSAPGVDDVSLTVRAGEIVGLAGLIGSGRTEVARTIFGADRRDAGSIFVNGKPVRLRTPRDAVAAGIALVPEDRKTQGLLMLRPVSDNMTLPHLSVLSHAGVLSNRRERSVVGDLMRRVDVRASSAAAKVNTLSGGNQQKVLFAKWLLGRPRLLIADEPTRGVDIGAKRAIYELIHSLAQQGLGVLLISSEHEEVLGLAHRVLVMRGGRVVADLEGEAMSEDGVLQAAFATQESPEGRSAA